MSVTAGVSDTVIAVRDKLRGKIEQTKVKRYWPGKVPEWAEDNDECGGNFRMSSLEKAFHHNDGYPRLRRLAQSKIDNRRLDEVRKDHRRIRQAEIISTVEEESRRLEGVDVEEENDEALEEKRRKIREKLLQRQQEEAALLPEEEESESEYETESEEEMSGMAMVKPDFVPNEERAVEEEAKRRIEERKRETKEIVVEKIKEDERNVELLANIADVDTDDDVNEAEEYEAWKAREIGRIKRDRDEREAMLKEREEIERVRNMTEEERREWRRKNPKPCKRKPKWRFMQKYYHKGAFFQTNADDRAGTAAAHPIYARDFSHPTGEDKMDKSDLPKVLQVKHFGRRGRTKWTHLANEDTADRNIP